MVQDLELTFAQLQENGLRSGVVTESGSGSRLGSISMAGLGLETDLVWEVG